MKAKTTHKMLGLKARIPPPIRESDAVGEMGCKEFFAGGKVDSSNRKVLWYRVLGHSLHVRITRP
jgi:hypothetical protein